LRLLGDLVAARTHADWAVLDLLLPGVRGQQKAIAAALGVSVQAVSQTMSRAKVTQEVEGRVAADLLLRLTAFAVE
jgi:FixJ family two-component response regulator